MPPEENVISPAGEAGLAVLDLVHPGEELRVGFEAGMGAFVDPELLPFGFEGGIKLLDEISGAPPTNRLVKTRGFPVTWEPP